MFCGRIRGNFTDPSGSGSVTLESIGVIAAGRGHLHGLQAGRELHPHQNFRESRHQLQRPSRD